MKAWLFYPWTSLMDETACYLITDLSHHQDQVEQPFGP